MEQRIPINVVSIHTGTTEAKDVDVCRHVTKLRWVTELEFAADVISRAGSNEGNACLRRQRPALLEEAVDNLVRRPVSADRDDGPNAVLERLASKRRGVCRAGGECDGVIQPCGIQTGCQLTPDGS